MTKSGQGLNQSPSGGYKEHLVQHELQFHKRVIPTYNKGTHVVKYQRVFDTLGLKREDFRNKSVLDVGCGPISALHFIDAKRKVAVDPLLEEYRPLVSHISVSSDVLYLIAQAEDLPLENGTFDYVFAFNGIDHWEDWHLGIAEIKRVLKPGGKLCLWVNLDRPCKSPGHIHSINEKFVGWIGRLGFKTLMGKVLNKKGVRIFFGIFEKF